MPDLLAGTTILALDTPVSQHAFNSTDEIRFTSTVYIPGDTAVGLTFIAPTTGRVRVEFSVVFEANTSNTLTYLSFQVRLGGVIGSGTIILAPQDTFAVISPADASGGPTTQLGASNYRDVEGLIPGTEYNVQTMHRISGGNGDIFFRRISVTPLS